jgi:hypothetical protein
MIDCQCMSDAHIVCYRTRLMVLLQGQLSVFLDTLEPYALSGRLTSVPALALAAVADNAQQVNSTRCISQRYLTVQHTYRSASLQLRHIAQW